MSIIKLITALEVLDNEIGSLASFSSVPQEVILERLDNVKTRLAAAKLSEELGKPDTTEPTPAPPADQNHPLNIPNSDTHTAVVEPNAAQRDFSNRDDWALEPEHVKCVLDLMDNLKQSNFINSLIRYMNRNSYLTPRQAASALKNIDKELEVSGFGPDAELGHSLLETMAGREG